MFSKQELKDIETNLSKDEGKLFLVINNVDGTLVEGIFTNKDKASNYIIRECINTCLCVYEDYLTDCKDSNETPQSFEKIVRDNLFYYQIIDITYLNLKLDIPIYIIRSGDYNVFGCPTHYLTNDLEKWKKSLEKCKMNTESWIKECIAKIDPDLQDYDDCYVLNEDKQKE